MSINLLNLRNRYTALFGSKGANYSTLIEIQNTLDITFPQDFMDISQFHSGGRYVGNFCHLDISVSGIGENVVDETLRLRDAVNLPHRFVVLDVPGSSLAVLDTLPAVGGPSVIWCEHYDVDNLETQNWVTQPNCWSTYSEFFAYLIELEEEKRMPEKEDKNGVEYP